MDNKNYIKVSFRAGPDEGVGGESMWVNVVKRVDNTVIGIVDNDPCCEGHGCKAGDRVVCVEGGFNIRGYYGDPTDLKCWYFVSKDYEYYQKIRDDKFSNVLDKAEKLIEEHDNKLNNIKKGLANG